jgi:N-methylhydantoinase A
MTTNATSGPSWLVGIDIGGTFTDVVALERNQGCLRTAKVPSRPTAPAAALKEALAAVDVDLKSIDNLVHGTTRITNAIVESKLPPVVLFTTAGFEDVLPIARLKRRDLYRLDVPPKLPPLVAREATVGVVERLSHAGEVLTPLTDDAIEATLAAAADLNATSAAVSLLHAYANPAHEIALGKALAARFAHLSLSHQINPEAREFERTTSTVLNAAAMPVVVDYLDELARDLPLAGRFQLFHSAGGWATPAAVRERPLVMALSGPAAGVTACANFAGALARKDLLTFDMGGTTTDVCLVVDGEIQVTDQRDIAERPMRQPMVAIESIGAGGGSVVRLGSGGLAIGPDSAGADPGPACYGRGGIEATVTDANAVLGYLDPQRQLGGAITLDVDEAERAIGPIAAELKRDVVETALGIVRIANATMARALRRVTVERGIDGRGCSLLAFGGAGPMHAVGLASEFGISEVIVPTVSSAFSAYGCVLSDMAYTRQQTVGMGANDFDHNRFEHLRDAIQGELAAPFVELGVEAEMQVEQVGLMRYAGQSSTVPVPLQLPLDLAALGHEFTERHRQMYGYATDEPWVLEGLRMRAWRPTSASRVQQGGHTPAAPLRHAQCWFSADAVCETPCYAREQLAIDQVVQGPALIEDQWSTIVVSPGWSASADRYANLFIREDV